MTPRLLSQNPWRNVHNYFNDARSLSELLSVLLIIAVVIGVALLINRVQHRRSTGRPDTDPRKPLLTVTPPLHPPLHPPPSKHHSAPRPASGKSPPEDGTRRTPQNQQPSPMATITNGASFPGRVVFRPRIAVMSRHFDPAHPAVDSSQRGVDLTQTGARRTHWNVHTRS